MNRCSKAKITVLLVVLSSFVFTVLQVQANSAANESNETSTTATGSSENYPITYGVGVRVGTVTIPLAPSDSSRQSHLVLPAPLEPDQAQFEQDKRAANLLASG